MKLGVEHARRCSSTSSRLPLDRIEELRRRRPAHRRRRAQQRPRRRTAPSASATRCSRRRCSSGASGQLRNLRDDRRQPAAAHALRLLPGRLEAVQQARARARAARRARATTATSRSSGTRRRASRRTRPTWPSRWPRSTRVVHVLGRERRADDPARRACTACPATSPQRDTVLEPGELITAVELPPLRARRAARATARCATARRSRSPLVSVAAALDVARRRRCATAGSRSAASRTRRGARWRAEEALRGGPATQERFAARRRRRARRRPQPLRDNAFKVPLARNLIVAHADRAGGGAVMADTLDRPARRRGARRASRAARRSRAQARYAVRARRRGRRLRLRSCRSTIASGAVARGRRRAPRSPLAGVLAVLSHENAPRAGRPTTTRELAVLQSPRRRLPRPDRRRRRRRDASRPRARRPRLVRVDYDAERRTTSS